jgi:hypothetical protein
MKGVIYKLICNETNEVYFGSTTQKINERVSDHKAKCKAWKAGKYHYFTSFQIIERGNYKYELVEEVVYEDKKQLETRERYYIENNDCINKVIPTRSIKEYRQANKDAINEYNKAYHQANKDAINARKREYRVANKDAINARQKELRLQKKIML